MAFFLKIETQYDEETKKFSVTETNSTWGGDNPERNEVEEAEIIIEGTWQTAVGYAAGSFNITDEVRDNNLENYVLDKVIDNDGIYLLYLKVKTESNRYTSKGDLELVASDIKKQISKFWAKYAFTSSVERKKTLYDICSKLEAFFSGLKSLCLVHEKDKAAELLSIIERTIELNKTYLY